MKPSYLIILLVMNFFWSGVYSAYKIIGPDVPTGGIKVIYRHAELLASLGADAAVLHPFDTTFRCSWFEHTARFEQQLTLDPSRDLVIIPELWAGTFGPQCLQQGVRYAIFVQNGYFTYPILPSQGADLLGRVFAAADLILAISDDTARMTALN